MHLSAHLWSLGCLIPLTLFWCILNVAEILGSQLAVGRWQWAVISSAAEPLAISKNLAFSFPVDRSMPTAMFDGIERLERVIWSLNPKSFRFAIDR